MYRIKCLSCGNTIDNSEEKHYKCIECGSEEIENTLILLLKDRVEQDDFVKGKRRITGKKNPASEFQNGSELCIRDGKRYTKTRIIDRENNQYYERVENHPDGDVIHSCEEPLSDHFGHGYAKNNNKR